MEKLELEDGEEVEAKKHRTRQVGAEAGKTDLEHGAEAGKTDLEHGEEADGENGGGERLARVWSDSLGDSCGRASRTR